MIYTLSSPTSVDQLVDGITKLGAQVEFLPMGDDTVELELGPFPIVWLNIDSPPENQAWALLDVVRVLMFGPEAAQHGEWVRDLRSVG